LLYFNFIRYGALVETGYTQEISFQLPLEGGFGLLFSPGLGLFIYAPIMWLLLFGIRPAWRRLPRLYFILIATLCIFYWLFYGSWFSWGGPWGWGPRFLVSVTPLLMIFVAEPVAWLAQQKTLLQQSDTPLPQTKFRVQIAQLGILCLVIVSLIVNFLGIIVDFNEHFLRLGLNPHFAFNWAEFPPLIHWQILREGLTDVIWLQPTPTGFRIEWAAFLPPLILVIWSGVQLALSRVDKTQTDNHSSRVTYWHPLIFTLVALILTYQMMLVTARIALADEQSQFDWPLLETLNTTAQAGDAILIAMPPFGDVQETSLRMMSYLDQPVSTAVWVDTPPREIQPIEREQLWQATVADSQRIWLFERWLTPQDDISVFATRLKQEAFVVEEQWFEGSGKLTLYDLAADNNVPKLPSNVRFQGGLTLVDFSVHDTPLSAGDTFKLRLTWEATSTFDLPNDQLIVFAQLLDQNTPAQNIAQQDRLLIDLQNIGQSPLLPGQTVSQGYGLSLPDELAPGSYPVVVGLYLASNGQRLLRADGIPDDFVYLINVSVE
ncbi:MAG: hypothetical protein AAF485_29255, partial [Chloroflexota bacterium]